MSRQTMILLGGALIMAMAVLWLRHHFAAPEPVEAAPVAAVSRVVVARHDMVLGSFVQGEQDLEWADAPQVKPDEAPAPDAPQKESYLHEGVVKLTDFNGAVVRRALRAGEPVPQSALMKSGEGGFMSAVLEPGMRAVSIAVTATSGNAGFISPGDRVDLIVTHRVRVHSGEPGQEDSVVSETFVRDVRVIAVDQQLDNPENKAILAKTVTVEVSPQQVEKVSVAEEMGKISLALRSLAGVMPKVYGAGAEDKKPATVADVYGIEQDEAQAAPMTRDSDVSQMLNRTGVVAPRVQIFRGDQVQNLDFYQDSKR